MGTQTLNTIKNLKLRGLCVRLPNWCTPLQDHCFSTGAFCGSFDETQQCASKKLNIMWQTCTKPASVSILEMCPKSYLTLCVPFLPLHLPLSRTHDFTILPSSRMSFRIQSHFTFIAERSVLFIRRSREGSEDDSSQLCRLQRIPFV